MTRQQIEAMMPTGLGVLDNNQKPSTVGYSGWEASMPGPIADSRWKSYTADDGMVYILLDKQERYKVGCTEKGIPFEWKDLEPNV